MDGLLKDLAYLAVQNFFLLSVGPVGPKLQATDKKEVTARR